MRKLRTKVMALALAFALGVAAPAALPSMYQSTVASAANVKLNQKKVSLKVGQTKKLKLIRAKKTITWSSDNISVATVSKSGKVTAKAEGTATITAKAGEKKYTCIVTVTAKKDKKDKKAKNQTYTLDNVTFNVPSTVKCESKTEDTVSMMAIGLPDNDTEGIFMTNSNLEGQKMTYEQWEELINSQLDALGTTTGISEFKRESVDTNLGKGIYATYKIGTYTVVQYAMYINEHAVGITYSYDTVTSKVELQATFDMIMKTIKLVK